jgi:hypothetical protein
LGLAIVKKIMEDHGGRLVLDDRPGGGASVRLVFPRGEAAQGADPAAGEGAPAGADGPAEGTINNNTGRARVRHGT